MTNRKEMLEGEDKMEGERWKEKIEEKKDRREDSKEEEGEDRS